MKFSWLFNGTMQAHHLLAVYVSVWVIQGGYAAWIAWQSTRAQVLPRTPLEPSMLPRDRRP